MKTPMISLLLSLLCCSSLALALGDPYKAGGPGIAHPLGGKHALKPNLLAGQPTAQSPTPRGTNSQGYNPWVEQITGVPDGFDLRSLDVVDENIAWAVVSDLDAVQDHSLIWTTDGGTTWTCDTIDIAPRNFNSMGICALDASTCWVAMVDNSGASGGGIFHTTDGGTTWTKVPNAFTAAGGFADFIWFFDANNGVCVGDPTDQSYEIYATSDAGTTWSRVPQANMPPILPGETAGVSMFCAAGSSLWFPTFPGGSSSARFYRTSDKGLTWSVNEYPGISPGRYPALAFQDDNNGLGSGAWGEVSRTTDGGSTWTRLATSLNLAFDHIVYVPGTSGMYVASVTWHSLGVEGGYRYGTAYTVDGGINWTIASTLDSYWLDFASVSAGWSGCYGPNIGKWEMAQGRVIGAALDVLGFGVLEAGGTSGTMAVDAVNFGSELLTLSGIVEPGPDFVVTGGPSFPAVLAPLASTRFEVSFTPHGRGLKTESLGIVSDATNQPEVIIALTGKSAEFSPPLPGLIYATSDSLYTLSPANPAASPVGTLEGPVITGLTVRPADSVLFGITTGATSALFKIDPVLGIGVQMLTIPVSNLRAIAFAPTGTLFGGVAGKLIRIDMATGDTTVVGTDAGKAYSAFSFNPTNGLLYASVAPPIGSPKDGIYTVDTLTGKATLVGQTGDSKATPSIAFNADGTLYALKGTGATVNTLLSISLADGHGTELGGLGKSGLQAIAMLDLATGVGGGTTARVPAVYSLRQNYPNPFNPRTTITFELPKSSDVRLSVYDILGREVFVLANGRRDAGVHEVKFDGSKLASGVYFYRLQAGDFVQAKKLVIAK